jgi:NAD(P)-dependent dehydrogenase (short-subunit alcohol dehydrogenase family)
MNMKTLVIAGIVFTSPDHPFNSAAVYAIIRRNNDVRYLRIEPVGAAHAAARFAFEQRLARRLGREMVRRGHGKVLFTASLLSFQGGIDVAAYAAAKSAVAGLTRALANEWAPHGVNVNAIVPGYIATDNTQALRDDPARNQAIVDRIPAGRWGVPDDLAGATVFLASAASDYVNGILLPVDGGWLAR